MSQPGRFVSLIVLSAYLIYNNDVRNLITVLEYTAVS